MNPGRGLEGERGRRSAGTAARHADEFVSVHDEDFGDVLNTCDALTCMILHVEFTINTRTAIANYSANKI